MENGEKGRAPSLDDVVRAVLPEGMPMHPDHPMQQAAEPEDRSSRLRPGYLAQDVLDRAKVAGERSLADRQRAEPVKQAPAQDERKTFEAWAKTQGDKWLIVGGLQWSAGTDDYASARTNAAWAAWQERAALSARPAQTEQQPPYSHEAMDVIATSRYQVVASGSGPLSRYYVRAGDGKCELYRGGKSDCEHVARKLAGAFLDGGLTAFGLYAAPIAQTAPQPEQSGLSDPRQWTDQQVLDFLGVALRNVDVVGTVHLSEIRQGFELVMGRPAMPDQGGVRE